MILDQERSQHATGGTSCRYPRSVSGVTRCSHDMRKLHDQPLMDEPKLDSMRGALDRLTVGHIGNDTSSWCDGIVDSESHVVLLVESHASRGAAIVVSRRRRGDPAGQFRRVDESDRGTWRTSLDSRIHSCLFFPSHSFTPCPSCSRDFPPPSTCRY